MSDVPVWDSTEEWAAQEQDGTSVKNGEVTIWTPIVDSFERAELAPWTGNATIQSTYAAVGDSALETTDSAEFASSSREDTSPQIEDGDVLVAWMNNGSSGGTDYADTIWSESGISNGSSDNGIMWMSSTEYGHRITTHGSGGGAMDNSAWSQPMNVNEWYKCEITVYPSQSTIDANILSSTGDEILSVTDLAYSGTNQLPYRGCVAENSGTVRIDEMTLSTQSP